MSIKTLFSALQAKVGGPITKLVLLKLADNANDKGECWPSYDNIAEVCEISKRSAINHVNKLIALGVLTKTIRKGEKGNSSNVYHLNLDGEPSAPPGERAALGGEPSAPPPGERAAPESVRSFESVNESKDMSEANAADSVIKIKKSSTPYKKIHDLYQKILVETGDNNLRLVDVLVLDTERKAKIKSFWALLKMDIDNVEKYFTWIWDNRDAHNWLFGVNGRGWRADIEYICREKTIRKAKENQLSNWEEAA